ncbi:MAG: ankyrin repeat domain-containing protein [Candidatus Babeliales bacterium]
MDIIKPFKIYLFLLSITLTPNSFSMEEGSSEPLKKVGETEEINALEQLPPEIQTLIITAIAEGENNLNTIIHNLISFAQTNKFFYESLQDSHTIGAIIKKLQEKNPAEPLLYALILAQLPGAKKWIQEKIADQKIELSDLEKYLFTLTQSPNRFQRIVTNSIGFEFKPTLPIIFSIMNAIFKAGINPNIQNHEGYTPLMYAIILENIPMVKFLLSIPEINLNIQNQKDRTAFDVAESIQNKEITKLLQNKKEKNE